ncbi:MAG: class I SAM-dependent methyltransferase [Kordiimonadaceae bacterium]|nr:class I SAM-dependent methyltransferase [Kordiimonadaceae bacterium]MBO6569952.1 class I SAM-dependent methyltransferase [Kordiimonadaceae bacterium]MBO6965951.1 class I SAM-dependent methyltransferase [Kordiimonadaceae bacterium]
MIRTIAKACALAAATLIVSFQPAVHAENLSADERAKLETILAAQPDSVKARYQYRHPLETLDFLGVKPGMTVADTLPGSYYSNILLPYLGNSGKLVGVSYSIDHRALDYGDNEERMARFAAWPERFVSEASEWRGEGKTEIDAFLLGAVPENAKGTVDAFLLFRAMHHLNKYEDRIGTRTNAFKDIYAALKPGGIVGIVQHRSPVGNSDEWAKGFNGYIKQQPLIDNMIAAGFEFVGASEVNANPKDVPTEGDYVWRLPPRLAGSDDDPEKRARLEAVGESDRMTLKFRKP